MKAVAEGIWQLDGFPAHAINAFFADGVLFDCRTRWSAGHIARQLRDDRVSLIALTHAHPDHWGAAPTLSRRLGVPVAVHHADAEVVSGRARAGEHIAFELGRRFLEGGACDDVVPLQEGDQVGEFTVVHAPGHSSGHVIYFRERDRVAVAGDIVNTMELWSRRRRLGQPPPHLSVDAAENRRSIAKLVSLRPSLVLPGHGPALEDTALLVEFERSLPPSPVRETAGSAVR